MTKFSKGQTVFYRASAGSTVRGVVKTVHRDGSVSVTPQFFVGKDGADLPGYIGGAAHRFDPAQLTAESPAA